MNMLPLHKRVQIINLLVEGMSLRATARVCNVSRNSVSRLLAEVGQFCIEFHDATVHGIKAKRIQCDEIWSFVYMKRRNVPEESVDIGDVWTWVCIDADTKLVISYYVGKRDLPSARIFVKDFASRISGRVQLSTDGLRAYINAVDEQFGARIDFAQMVKVYEDMDVADGDRKYSPVQFVETKRLVLSGAPDQDYISTSYVERQNLTMRMHSRRFTRLTNAFSKKHQYHVWAIALHFVYYNFCKIHSTIRTTPAISAGMVQEVMQIEDIVNFVDKKSN